MAQSLFELEPKKVSINGIWFSLDGGVRSDVLENLKSLRKQINKSQYAFDYDVCFWTDTDKLKGSIRDEPAVKHECQKSKEIHL